jgi:hypothetical protein
MSPEMKIAKKIPFAPRGYAKTIYRNMDLITATGIGFDKKLRVNETDKEDIASANQWPFPILYS